VHTYVINLARSPERRAHIREELLKTGVPYEFVSAVDGRDLDLHDQRVIDPAMLDRNDFPAGSAGCALSHLRVYEKVVADGLDQALVLEDDVELPPDLEALLEAVSPHLTGAEVALLNYVSWEVCKLSREDSIPLPGSGLLALPVNLASLGNAAGYVITREACERMIEGALPLRANADAWTFFFNHGFLDRVRCIYPMAITKSPEFESTIGIYSLGSGVRARVLTPVVRHRIPLLHEAIVRRRHRITRYGERTELVDVPFIFKPSRLDSGPSDPTRAESRR
jgi:glycosyl transferase family 25